MSSKKYLSPVFAACLLSITGMIQAAEDTQLPNLENSTGHVARRDSSERCNPPPPVCRKPEPPVCCKPDRCCKPDKDLPYKVHNGIGLLFQVDAFYWQGQQSGLEFAVENHGGTLYANNGKIIIPHFKWDPGLKLGAGYDMCHDGWDLFLQWTRFYPKGHRTTNAPSGGTVYPSFFNQFTPASTVPGLGQIVSGFQSATAHWKLKLNILDLELGKDYFISKRVDLRPFVGFRSAWVNQDFNIKYTNGSIALGGATLSGHTITATMENNFWGMGLRGGLDGNWRLGCWSGWSIFSDLAASLLCGDFKVSESESDISVSPASNRLHVTEKFWAARAVLDIDLGIRYKHDFACKYYALMAQLGWEQHLFFNQNQLKKFLSSGEQDAGQLVGCNGDLNTQGLTLSLRFDF